MGGDISEAGDAQILLNWLLGGGQATQPIDARRAQRARQAAQELADRSHQAVQTGSTATATATVSEARLRLGGRPHAQHDDRGLEFLDSPAREQLLHQITGTATTGASPVQHPSEGEDQ